MGKKRNYRKSTRTFVIGMTFLLTITMSACKDKKQPVAQDDLLESPETETVAEIDSQNEVDQETEEIEEGPNGSDDSAVFGETSYFDDTIDEAKFNEAAPHTDGILQDNAMYTQMNYFNTFGSLKISEKAIDGVYFYDYVSEEDGIEVLINAEETGGTVLFQGKQMSFSMRGGFFHVEHGSSRMALVDLTGDGVKEFILENYQYAYDSDTSVSMESYDDIHIMDLVNQREIPVEDIASNLLNTYQFQIVKRDLPEELQTFYDLVKMSDTAGNEYYGYIYAGNSPQDEENLKCSVSFSYIQDINAENGMQIYILLSSTENKDAMVASFLANYQYDKEQQRMVYSDDIQVEMTYSAIFYTAKVHPGEIITEKNAGGTMVTSNSTVNANTYLKANVRELLGQEGYTDKNIQVDLLYELRKSRETDYQRVYKATLDDGYFYLMYEGKPFEDNSGNYVEEGTNTVYGWNLTQVKYEKL